MAPAYILSVSVTSRSQHGANFSEGGKENLPQNAAAKCSRHQTQVTYKGKTHVVIVLIKRLKPNKSYLFKEPHLTGMGYFSF